MTRRQLSEKQVLRKLGIQDFRHLTKEKAITLVSMLDRVDPRVATEALKQFPEFAGMLVSELKEFKEVVVRSCDSNDESNRAAMATIDSVIQVLSGELRREDLSDNERLNLGKQLVELAKMAAIKDTENKKHQIRVLKIWGGVVAVIAGLAAAAIGVNVHGVFTDSDGASVSEDNPEV